MTPSKDGEVEVLSIDEVEIDETELDADDLTVRDRPYESFGEQGVALATYAVFGHGTVQDHTCDGWCRGVEKVGLGDPVGDEEELVKPGVDASETGTEAASSATQTDAAIRREVARRVGDDDAVDAAQLAVSVRAGEVILAGTVPHPQQRDRAMRLAGSVRGVIRVTSRVHVRSRVRRSGSGAAGGR